MAMPRMSQGMGMMGLSNGATLTEDRFGRDGSRRTNFIDGVDDNIRVLHNPTRTSMLNDDFSVSPEG